PPAGSRGAAGPPPCRHRQCGSGSRPRGLGVGPPLELAPGTSATVRVPASSANLGPGFDSVGLALGLWDECTATVTDGPGLRIVVEGEGSDDVPRNARHLVHRTMAIA